MRTLLLLVPLAQAPADDLPLDELYAELAALDAEGGIEAFYAMCALAPEEFVTAARAEQGRAEALVDAFRARHDAPEDAVFGPRAEIVYGWAEGYAVYPNVHRQITGSFDFEPPEELASYLDELDFEDERLLEVPAFDGFLRTHLATGAHERLRRDADLRAGDNCMTRASYELALELSANEAVRNHALHAVLDQHFENHHVERIEPLLERFERDCTDPARVQDIVHTYERLRAERDGHAIEVYREVDGLELEIHLWFPDDESERARPVLVWFHGGGWQFGSWSWTLGLDQVTERGMVFASVDYRTAHRHWASPLDGLSDARAALRWVRANADRLGVDPDRVVAGGFSAGGHLSAAAVLLPPIEPDPPNGPSSVPDAAVLWSAPIDVRADGWFRESLHGSGREPVEYSPSHRVRSTDAPFLVLHGERDTICPFDATQRFVTDMVAAGNRCELEAFDGSHFFQFEDAAQRSAAVARLEAFLDSLDG